MLIKNLKGEFDLLSRIIRRDKEDPSVVVPNGDDAAVVRINGKLLAITTDTLIEGRDFSLEYFSGKDLGERAFESSASDIAAMGGKPLYAFVSIVLRDSNEVKFVEEIYDGLYGAADRPSTYILGGDTSKGGEIALTVTVIGTIKSDSHLCTRSGAKKDDLVFVTGELGGSRAGLIALQKKVSGFEDLKKKHCGPKARVDLVDAISPHATSMIDISDGLSSELHHIATESKCGILVYEEKIPIGESTRAFAKLVNNSPSDYAMSGGEDFELLYTISPLDRRHATGFEIGKVIDGRGVLVDRVGKRTELLATGFDHFK